MVTKDQIQLVVSGKNETGPVFKDVTDEIKRLRAEASRPISLARVEQGDRDRLAGFTRGLRRAGNSAEERVRRDSLLPGRELSAGDLIREQNSRFRATGTGGLQAVDKEANSLARAFKATLIAGALIKTAQAIGNIPEAVKAYRDMLKVGENRFAALGKSVFDAIPFVSHFADAGRALTQAMIDLRDPIAARAREEKDRLQGDKEVRQGLTEKRDARRNAIAQSASQALSESGRRGVTDELSLAQFGLQDELAKAGKIRSEAGALAPDQQKKARAAADEIELRARKVFEAERVRITEAADKEIRDKAKANADEIRKINDDAAVTRLRNQGKELEASILAIQQANQREVEEAKGNSGKIYALKLRASEEIRGLRNQDAASRARSGLDVLAGDTKTGTTTGSAGVFSGEARLLTGAGSSIDPLLQPTKNMDRNLAALTSQQKADAGTMISLLTTLAQGAIAGPI